MCSPGIGGRATEKALARAVQEADARGLLVRRLEARNERLTASPSRVRRLLSGKAAHDLYRSLHRCPALVLALDDVRIAPNPSRRPATDAQLIKLGTFVAHKAAYARAPHADAVAAAFERYDAWIGSQGCDGPNDPRVLPLHVFETQGDWSRLGEAGVDKRFASLYKGRDGSRTDEGGKVWRRDGHGRELLTVAGCKLSPGMHWDVKSARGGADIMNGVEILRLRGPHGYVNVSPDAHFHLSPGRSTARRIWPQTGEQAP